MSRNILWIFLATAPLVSAGSLDENFQATCGLGVTATAPESYACSGVYRNGPELSFSYGGPFPGSPGFEGNPGGPRYEPGQRPPPIVFYIGRGGGTFSSPGHTCNYQDVINGVDCDGEVTVGAELPAPGTFTNPGLSLGDVVSVVGTGEARGFFRYGEEFHSNFDLMDVRATYQFTLTDLGTTDQGTFELFSFTAAQFSFGAAPVPEPGTWAFAILGLTGVAIGFRRPSNLRLKLTRVRRALGVK